jgi:streptogramin lyase
MGGRRRRIAPARYLLVAAIVVLGWSATAPAQTITEYPIPAGSSGPTVITTGPDGALWFTLDGTNQIGRITTAGAVTVFAIPNGQ